MDSSEDRLIGAYDGAFSDEALPYVENGIRNVSAAGTRDKGWVRYWASAKARAAELIGRPPVPGLDYALTEVVHCATRNETAVESAREQCVPRYLEHVLRLSPAIVIVVYGKHAACALEEFVPAARKFEAAEFGLYGPMMVFGRERRLLKLPHPNSRGYVKRAAKYLKLGELEMLREGFAGRVAGHCSLSVPDDRSGLR